MISNLELFAWIAFAATLWIFRELLLGLWAWRKARRYQHVLKVERTRGQFAIIRNRLAALTIGDRLDPRSVTFNRLYLVNTVFMRSPDRYPALSQVVHQAIMDSKNQRASPALWRESKSWSPEVRQLVIQTADAMQQVLMDYSWIFLFYYRGAEQKERLERRYANQWQLARNVMSSLRSVAQAMVDRLEKRNPEVVEIRKAQTVMYRIAQ